MAQVDRFVVVVEVDLRIVCMLTLVKKHDANKVIDGPVANGHRRSSSTVNFVEAFFSIRDKGKALLYFFSISRA